MKKNGYTPTSFDEKESKNIPIPVSPDEVRGSLSASLDSVGKGSYSINFTAKHPEALYAEAIASGAAAAFIDFHREQLTRQTRDNKREYKKLLSVVTSKLDAIKKHKLDEFQISETQAIGFTLEERIKALLKDLKETNEKKDQAKIDIDVALKNIEFLQAYADKIPMHDVDSFSERALALENLLTELRKEYYSLTRKRSDFGPDHPMQTKIRELNEDIQLIERELEEIRTGDAADLDRRNINPERAKADGEVAMVRSQHHDATLRFEMESKKIKPFEEELATMRKVYESSREMRVEENSLNERKVNYSLKIEEMSAVESSADLDLALLSPDIRATAIKTNSLIGIAVGLILGLIAGILVAIMLLRRRQVEGAKHA